MLTTFSQAKHQITTPITDFNSAYAVDVNGVITAPGLLLPNETISRLSYIDPNGQLKSVLVLTSWIAGTANEIGITDDGDGTLTIGIVDPLIVGKGGTGLATITDGGLMLGSGTAAVTALARATNGQIPIGSTGADPILATITAVANETDITNAAGSITIGIVDPLIVAKGGSGRATSTTAYGLIAAGTTATAAHQTLAAGLTTQILIGGGAAALPAWGTDIPTAVTIGSAYIYRAGGTDVPVGDGGTGLSDPTDHSLLLGSGATALTELGVATNGQLPIGSTGADPVLATLTGTANQITSTAGAGTITLSLPQDIHTGASPYWTAVNVGHATDTTVSRASAGDLSIEGNIVYRAGGTDVPVGDGGTGLSDPTDHSLLLGSGASALTQLGVATNGQIPIGSTGADPVLAGITGTASEIGVTNGAGSITLAMLSPYTTLVDDSMVDTLHRHSELSASDGAPNPALNVDASGQVGINIATPGRLLDIWNITGNGNPQLRLSSASETIDPDELIGGIEFYTNDTSVGAQAVVARINARAEGGHFGGDLPTGLRFMTCPDGTGVAVEKVRIDNAGQVGINIATPGRLLDIWNITGNANPQLRISSASETIDPNEIIGGIEFYTNDTSVGAQAVVAGFNALAEGGHFGGDLPTGIQFITTPDGTDVAVEQVRLDNAGQLGVNTTTPDTTLQVVGTVGFGDDAGNETLFAADGEHTMAGTARVMISIDLEPVLATRPAANPPGEGTEDAFPTHDFNPTTDESVYFHLELSHDYAAAGLIHVHFDFFVDTAPASAESVVWGVEYKKQSIGDNFDFSAGTTTGYTQTSVTTGTPANDKKTHQSAEVSLTTTGFAAGDYILLRLFRDADGTGGTDDYTADARVIDYHIEYLSDKLGEAT